MEESLGKQNLQQAEGDNARALDQLSELELNLVEGSAWCGDCLQDFPLQSRIDLCPKCGAPPSRITGGNDLQVRAIEVE